MSPKEYLFSLGITDDPSKGLFVKRDDMQFDIAQVMEDYANLAPCATLIDVCSRGGRTEYIMINDASSVGVCNTDSFGHPLSVTERVTDAPWPGALTGLDS